MIRGEEGKDIELSENNNGTNVEYFMEETNKASESYVYVLSSDEHPSIHKDILRAYEISNILKSYEPCVIVKHHLDSEINQFQKSSQCSRSQQMPINPHQPNQHLNSTCPIPMSSEQTNPTHLPPSTSNVLQSSPLISHPNPQREPSVLPQEGLDETNMKIRNITQGFKHVRKEKYPSIQAKVTNSTFQDVTIDEGAELNCLDLQFCLTNNIKFKKTEESATAAGKTVMNLAGQTSEHVILKPTDNHHITWNLGHCVVVRNLGLPILLGEPAKTDNVIVTKPHQKKIVTQDSMGREVELQYLRKISSNEYVFLCR